MTNDGLVIITEDDKDDRDVLQEIFLKLGYSNEIRFYADGESALDQLNRTDVIPFLILSDINKPKLDGMALRKKLRMNARLHRKCIPFLFFTTASSRRAVVDAYSESVQGFFVEPNLITELEETIILVM